MSAQVLDNDLYLLVESGPHMGARVALGHGSYEVGQDPTCDLVLRDEGLAPRHLRLLVGEFGEVEIEALDERVRVNGSVIGASRVQLYFDDVVVIGRSTLRLWSATGRAGGRSPVVWTGRATRMGDAVEGGMRVALSRLGTVHPALQRTVSAPLNWLDSGAGSRMVGVGVMRAIAVAGGVSDWMQQRWRLVSVIAVAVMFVALSLPVSSHLQSTPTYGALDSEALRLQTALADNAFEGMNVSVLQDGSGLVVTGTVRDGGALDQLRQFVESQRQGSTRLNVQIDSEVVARVQDVVQKMGLPHLTIDRLGDGSLVASGYVVDKAQWHAARDTIVRDFIGIDAIKDDAVFDSNERMASLQSMLLSAGLLGDLTVQAKADGSLMVGGVLSEPVLDDWVGVLTAYRKEYGELPVVESEVRSLNEILKIDVRSASTGKVPHIIMREGASYLVGSTLPGGYVISEIHPHFLLLERNGKSVQYMLGVKLK